MTMRNVLITGAAGGIGQALVAKFHAQGDHVFAQDRNEAGLQQLCIQYSERMTPLVTELTHEHALKAALPHGITIDVLIANAAWAEGLTLRTTEPHIWRSDIENNLTAAYLSVNAVLEGMRAQKQGAVVFIGTVNAQSALGHPAYSAAKAGLISYMKSLTIEYGREGIRFNMVSPGTVKTPAWHARAAKDPQVFEKLKKWYPLQDFATPEDVAEATWFLASPQARMISGALLAVDGGLSAGNPVMASELTLQPF